MKSHWIFSFWMTEYCPAGDLCDREGPQQRYVIPQHLYETSAMIPDDPSCPCGVSGARQSRECGMGAPLGHVLSPSKKDKTISYLKHTVDHFRITAIFSTRSRAPAAWCEGGGQQIEPAGDGAQNGCFSRMVQPVPQIRYAAINSLKENYVLRLYAVCVVDI